MQLEIAMAASIESATEKAQVEAALAASMAETQVSPHMTNLSEREAVMIAAARSIQSYQSEPAAPRGAAAPAAPPPPEQQQLPVASAMRKHNQEQGQKGQKTVRILLQPESRSRSRSRSYPSCCPHRPSRRAPSLPRNSAQAAASAAAISRAQEQQLPPREAMRMFNQRTVRIDPHDGL